MYRRSRTPRRRRGAVLVESALVYPVVMLLTLGTISIALGIVRYQQVAWLAREGARWAAVRGPKYQSDQSQAAPISSSVMTNAIVPRLGLLNQSNLTCTLTMTSGRATVTLTYAWTPEVYLSPITLRSTSVVPISY